MSDSTAELERLRGQTVAQARELALLRWEYALLRQSRAASTVGLKYALLSRFPRLAKRASHAKRRVSTAVRAIWPQIHKLEKTPDAVKGRELFGEQGGLLILDTGPIAAELASTMHPGRRVLLTPGAGPTRSLSVAQEDEPPLRRPLPGSFVEWMAEDPRRLRRMDAIIVEAADDISLALLRGRLRGSQRLILTHSTGLRSSLVDELGAPETKVAGASVYGRLPLSWLDPLDDERRPDPAVASSRSWPKISVVMVSYYQAAFLEEGIRSVLDQAYPNLEFIIVDGQSTDGSIEILERYRSRAAYLLIERDRGQSDGLNKGFARATGTIVTWLNSDDLLEPGALFRVAQAFETHGVDMVAGGCRQIGLTRTDIIRNHHAKLPFGTPVVLPLGLLLDFDRFWNTASFFYQPEVFFSRDIWLRSGGALRTDLNYVLDYDLWVRAAAAGATIVHIPDFLACSRTHDQQKTREGMPYMPEVQRLLSEYGRRLLPNTAS